MKIDSKKWAEIREAVASDDKERFESLLNEAARIFVAHSRDFAVRCDRVRARERGHVPYLISER